MKDIAEKLQNAVVEAQEFKDFLAAISCERYSDLPLFHKQRRMLEQNFPSYSEKTECDSQSIWGPYKLGRLPGFVYDDATSVPQKYSRSAHGTQESPVMSHVDDWVDGAQYVQRCLSKLSESMSASHPYIGRRRQNRQVHSIRCNTKRNNNISCSNNNTMNKTKSRNKDKNNNKATRTRARGRTNASV